MKNLDKFLEEAQSPKCPKGHRFDTKLQSCVPTKKYPYYPGLGGRHYRGGDGKIYDPSGLDAHAKKVGYNDELYPLNPNRYYSHNIDLAQDILSAEMEYAFYSAAANGDSPNYDTCLLYTSDAADE